MKLKKNLQEHDHFSLLLTSVNNSSHLSVINFSLVQSTIYKYSQHKNVNSISSTASAVPIVTLYDIYVSLYFISDYKTMCASKCLQHWSCNSFNVQFKYQIVWTRKTTNRMYWWIKTFWSWKVMKTLYERPRISWGSFSKSKSFSFFFPFIVFSSLALFLFY